MPRRRQNRRDSQRRQRRQRNQRASVPPRTDENIPPSQVDNQGSSLGPGSPSPQPITAAGPIATQAEAVFFQKDNPETGSTMAGPSHAPTPTSAPASLDGFVEPLENEQRSYFAGLSGGPRLVARTSRTRYVHDHIWDGPRKSLATIGDHPLVQAWSDDVRSALIAALEQADIDWDYFVPLRIGERPTDSPVVLLVGLRASTDRTWQAAMQAALQCRAIIQDHGVLGVEVEMIQSHVQPRASEASRILASSIEWKYSQGIGPRSRVNLSLAGINAIVQPLLPYPSHAIEQENERERDVQPQKGTMGLFFHLVRPPAELTSSPSLEPAVYGLTSRHVAIGHRLPPNQTVKPDANLPPIQILSSCPHRLSDAFSRFNDLRIQIKQDCRETEQDVSDDPTKGHAVELFMLQLEAPRYIVDLRATLSNMDMLDAQQRLIGPVAYSPCHHTGSHGQWVDCALVRIVKAGVENEVCVRDQLASASLVTVQGLLESTPQYSHVEFHEINVKEGPDDRGFLRLHGRDIPAQPPFDASGIGRTSHVVGKMGAKTGLTFGLTNEIEAVRHVPFETQVGGPVVAFHLIVLGIDGGAFSRPGDSGSCVFDTTGRVVGIVDAGVGSASATRYWRKHMRGGDVGDGDGQTNFPDVDAVSDQSRPPTGFSTWGRQSTDDSAPEIDVTFVTPIQWVMDDIRKLTGSEPEII
ncbi:hypothetical protein HMPREF1624_03745 [Sporothrix schenckii ATCC 58251]|uniref:Peptidase S1 domain-containing protein n=1 Tax=Sporothrix schenckii (strain ATCC 58251 / de Perez 2211183) TaxID=1391915 RepID=U7PXL2_SPOS1|nr:hypothetical protein HMPREF1624_03745 [Sporothrix schenckii ATCC 58251]